MRNSMVTTAAIVGFAGAVTLSQTAVADLDFNPASHTSATFSNTHVVFDSGVVPSHSTSLVTSEFLKSFNDSLVVDEIVPNLKNVVVKNSYTGESAKGVLRIFLPARIDIKHEFDHDFISSLENPDVHTRFVVRWKDRSVYSILRPKGSPTNWSFESFVERGAVGRVFVREDGTNKFVSGDILVDYALMQRIDADIIHEEAAELFNLYFPPNQSGAEWIEFFNLILEVFYWTLSALLGGVIGNLAYDMLKAGLSKKVAERKQSSTYWGLLEHDFNKVMETVASRISNNQRIGVAELVETTGIQDREKIKIMLKLMGGRHTHAGPQTCSYEFTHFLASSGKAAVTWNPLLSSKEGSDVDQRVVIIQSASQNASNPDVEDGTESIPGFLRASGDMNTDPKE